MPTRQPSPTATAVLAGSDAPSHTACPYDNPVYNTPPNHQVPVSAASGIILPHHLLAQPLIDDALAGVSDQHQTIVLLTPNHRGLGPWNITVSAQPWQTVNGTVEPDIDVINSLTDTGVAGIDEDSIGIEHAVCGLVTFLKKYFSTSQLVPVILKNSTTDEHITALASNIYEICPDCLIIASVDFVHNKPAAIAETLDAKSAAVLTALNRDALGDVTADSFPALTALMQIMQNRGIKNGTLLSRSDSYRISHLHPERVTSYLTVAFR